MKLRRALTAAAATAVIAPAALMAAPAAYATTGPGTETSAEPAPATPAPEQTGDTERDRRRHLRRLRHPARQTPGSGTETEPDEGAGTGWRKRYRRRHPGRSGRPRLSWPSTPAPPTTQAPSAGPVGRPAVRGGRGRHQGRRCRSALPARRGRRLVALQRARWPTPPTGRWTRSSRSSTRCRPPTWTRPGTQLDLEYQDPDTGRWTAFDEWTSGRYFGWFRLDPHRTAELTLRIRRRQGRRGR